LFRRLFATTRLTHSTGLRARPERPCGAGEALTLVERSLVCPLWSDRFAVRLVDAEGAFLVRGAQRHHPRKTPAQRNRRSPTSRRNTSSATSNAISSRARRSSLATPTRS